MSVRLPTKRYVPKVKLQLNSQLEVDLLTQCRHPQESNFECPLGSRCQCRIESGDNWKVFNIHTQPKNNSMTHSAGLLVKHSFHFQGNIIIINNHIPCTNHNHLLTIMKPFTTVTSINHLLTIIHQRHVFVFSRLTSSLFRTFELGLPRQHHLRLLEVPGLSQGLKRWVTRGKRWGMDVFVGKDWPKIWMFDDD